MKRLLLRSILAATLVVAATAMFTSPAQAAGKAPRGNPLAFIGDDTEHWSNIDCGDAAFNDLLVAPAGNAGWVTGDPDQMYLLTSISGEFTVTYPDQSQESYSFSQNYGNRTGKADRVTCTGDFGHTHDGVTEEGVMTFVVARIW